MPFEIQLDSPRLRDADLATLRNGLRLALSREDDVIAQEKITPAGQGARAAGVITGALLVEVLQSGAISALIGVLKAYISRDRSLSIKLRTPAGEELELDATNFREQAVMNMLKELVPDRERTAEPVDAEVYAPPEDLQSPQRRPAVVPITPANDPPASADGARKIAIVIGQSSFPEDPDLERLRFAGDDATALHNLLQGETGERFDKVELITETTHYEALARIEEIAATTKQDDLLMVYYAGHGLVRNQKLHLAFVNTRSDYVHSTAMKYGNLLDIVEQASARQRIVVLDCCYAGAVGESASRSAVR